MRLDAPFFNISAVKNNEGALTGTFFYNYRWKLHQNLEITKGSHQITAVRFQPSEKETPPRSR
jgi:hypothetical protein